MTSLGKCVCVCLTVYVRYIYIYVCVCMYVCMMKEHVLLQETWHDIMTSRHVAPGSCQMGWGKGQDCRQRWQVSASLPGSWGASRLECSRLCTLCCRPGHGQLMWCTWSTDSNLHWHRLKFSVQSTKYKYVEILLKSQGMSRSLKMFCFCSCQSMNAFWVKVPVSMTLDCKVSLTFPCTPQLAAPTKSMRKT